MSKPSKSDDSPILSLKDPWQDNSSEIWLASSLQFSRNLDRYKFPAKLSSDERNQVIALLQRSLLEIPSARNLNFFLANMLSPIEKEYLLEHYFSLESFHQAHGGEAFVVDEEGEFLAVVNVDDHLHLTWFDFTQNPSGLYSNAVDTEIALSKKVNFAYLEKFGYLTTDYSRCGTAFTSTVFLQVPALIHSNKLSDVLDETLSSGVVVKGLQGSPDNFLGDILRIENRYTIGTDEERILSTVRNAASKISAEEASLRQKIIEEHSPELSGIKDHIGRAFGLIKHSYQLETVEAIDALSLVKLGVSLGWIEKIKISQLNQTIFSCRRASFLTKHVPDSTPEDLLKRRAEYLHETLKDAVLAF